MNEQPCDKNRLNNVIENTNNGNLFTDEQVKLVCRSLFKLNKNCSGCPFKKEIFEDLIHQENEKNRFNPWFNDNSLDILEALKKFPRDILSDKIIQSYTSIQKNMGSNLNNLSSMTKELLDEFEASPGFFLLIYKFNQKSLINNQGSFTKFYLNLHYLKLINFHGGQTGIPQLIKVNRLNNESLEPKTIINLETLKGLGDKNFKNIKDSLIHWIEVTKDIKH